MIEKYKLFSGVLFTALWISLCWGFVQDEFFNSLEHIRPYLFFLIDIIYVGLGLFSLRGRRDILFFASFVLIVMISGVLNHQGMVTMLNGSRDFIGLVLAAPIIRLLLTSKWSGRFTLSVDRQLQVFLYLQAVCLVWQYLKYGACDMGGGSMGEGASGTISVLIYFVSFYLMCRRWNRSMTYFMNIRDNISLVILLFPTFLNETKISLVLLPFYFLLLIRIDRQFLLKTVASLPIIAVLCAGAIWTYLYFINNNADSVFSEENMQEYFIGEDIDDLVSVALMVQDEEIETDNLWVVDIPRISKLLMMNVSLEDTGGKIWFGAGVGQFRGTMILNKTHFASEFKWLLQGSRPLIFFIVIQLGIIGLIWVILNMISVVQTNNPYWFSWNVRLYLYLLLTISMIYNDSFRLIPYCFILFYIAMIGLSDGSRASKTDIYE